MPTACPSATSRLELLASRFLLAVSLGQTILVVSVRSASQGDAWVESGLPMAPLELEALYELRAGISEDTGLFKTWANDTHPCHWYGVQCECSAVFPMPPDCPALEDKDPLEEHVFGLDFGPFKPSVNRLTGTLSPYIGNLTEARVLYLHANRLSGTIPPEIGNMHKLFRIGLRDNLLTGTLPPEIGSSWLQDIYVDNNQLEGPIPEEWCAMLERPDSRFNVLHPGNNALLCGAVPECFHRAAHINPVHVIGTCLLYDDNGSRSHPGGVCDSTPPKCMAPGGCISTPRIIPSMDYFEFNFTDFVDEESGVREYRWTVGTRPGLQDAMAQQIHSGDVIPGGGPQRAVFNSTAVALTNGGTYFVTLSAVNGACPELDFSVYSDPILVDSTPPIVPMDSGQVLVFANSGCSMQETTQADTATLRACWRIFEEPESNISKYELAVVGTATGGPGGAAIGAELILLPFSSDDITCSDGYCQSWRDLPLVTGRQYRVSVKAYNAAGSFSIAQSASITIARPSLDSNSLTLYLLTLGLGAALLLLACVALIVSVAWHRRNKKQKVQRWRRRGYEEIKHGLADTIEGLTLCRQGPILPETSSTPAAAVATLDEVFFVFTDLEESTSMAAADPVSYAQMQAVHDKVMRRYIALCNGYEINTQGDAFEIAFPTAGDAIRFCLKVQEELLQRDWLPKTLQLPTCAVVKDHNGTRLFAGPRVRMGIHLAKAGEFKRRLNTLTNHLQFEGPAYDLAETIGDAGHGGQVVMDANTYESALAAQTLAVFNHMGFFAIGSSPTPPMSMYEVFPPLTSSMPVRHFPDGLRRVQLTSKGRGLSIATQMPFPSSDLGHGVVVAQLPEEISEVNYKAVLDTLATVGQMFQGIGVAAPGGHCDDLYVLPCAADAVRFACVAQSALMACHFPDKFEGSGVQPTEYAADDGTTVVFRGVRVGMVVHCGSVELALPEDSPGQPPPYLGPGTQMSRPAVTRTSSIHPGRATAMIKSRRLTGDYSEIRALADIAEPLVAVGAGDQTVSTVTALSHLVHPGQVILTNSAWKEVQAVPMRSVQFKSMGTHLLPGDVEPSFLMEVVPASLTSRTFAPLIHTNQIEPGFHDAPGAEQEMAIVFCKVKPCPGTSASGWSRDYVQHVYAEALAQWCEIAQDMALEFDGYQCKEIQGKFMLSFADLRDAIAFATSVHVALSETRWSADLLKLPEFAPKDGSPGGLTPAIGICWGKPTAKNPSRSTGRADYFGPICNTAARCMASASYGQALVDGKELHRVLGSEFPKIMRPKNRFTFPGSANRLPSTAGASGRLGRGLAALQRSWRADVIDAAEATRGNSSVSKKDLAMMSQAAVFDQELHGCNVGTSGPVQMRGLGMYRLKGIKEPVMLVQAWLPALTLINSKFPGLKGSLLDMRSKFPVKSLRGAAIHAMLPGEVTASLEDFDPEMLEQLDQEN